MDQIGVTIFLGLTCENVKNKCDALCELVPLVQF